MKAPKKVIAVMAMATLLGSGAGQAFASDFKTNTGVPGQEASQTAEKKHDLGNTEELSVTGDIDVNGIFRRRVTSFPERFENGEYLQVTMPISLNYTYNLDTNVLESAKGNVINESVYVENRGVSTASSH